MTQHRGMGRVFQPTYTRKNPTTGERELHKVTTWWIEYSDHGETHRENSKSRKESDARKLLKTRIGEAGIGTLLPSEIAKTTFEDLKKLITDDYTKNDHKTAGQLKIVLARLSDGFAGMKAIEITAGRIS